MNKVKKIAIGVAATGILLASAVPAFAAQPNNQACFGEDASSATQISTGFVGGLFSSIARNATPGAGVEVQAHLAGLVPDEVFPNTCND